MTSIRLANILILNLILLSLLTFSQCQAANINKRVSQTEENARYNTQDGSLYIPSVKVDDYYYQANLSQQNGYTFSIDEILPISMIDNPAATFNSSTAEVVLHRLEVNGILYSAKLQFNNGLLSLTGFTESNTTTTSDNTLRVPPEWETHAATWMQWPNQYEANMREAFANIIKVIQQYEPVHLLTGTNEEKLEAQQFLKQHGVSETNITWHIVPVDNAWMRDNGPIYVSDGSKTWIQNWQFDAWGGNFGEEVECNNDNRVPDSVAEYLGVASINHQNYILEKGNLEFNGNGILVLNWDCQDDRNPGLSKAEHEAILKKALGVSTIIWAYGHDPEDGTTGHIDGMARFVDQNTLAIIDFPGDSTENLAKEAEAAGLEVVWYPGDANWLVGNGFVVAASDGDSNYDQELKALLQSWFPGRDIYLIDVATISAAGGGIHCVTNDQPLLN